MRTWQIFPENKRPEAEGHRSLASLTNQKRKPYGIREALGNSRNSEAAFRHQNNARIVTDVLLGDIQRLFDGVNGGGKKHVLGKLSVQACDQDITCMRDWPCDGEGLVGTDSEIIFEFRLNGFWCLETAERLFQDF